MIRSMAQGLRELVGRVMIDPEFLADIRNLDVDLEPLPGEALAELIVRTLNVPQAVRERAKLAFGR